MRKNKLYLSDTYPCPLIFHAFCPLTTRVVLVDRQPIIWPFPENCMNMKKVGFTFPKLPQMISTLESFRTIVHLVFDLVASIIFLNTFGPAHIQLENYPNIFLQICI